MTDETIRSDFDGLYGALRAGEVPVPWDIGGPQPVVQQFDGLPAPENCSSITVGNPLAPIPIS